MMRTGNNSTLGLYYQHRNGEDYGNLANVVIRLRMQILRIIRSKKKKGQRL